LVCETCIQTSQKEEVGKYALRTATSGLTQNAERLERQRSKEAEASGPGRRSITAEALAAEENISQSKENRSTALNNQQDLFDEKAHLRRSIRL
jgi:hypothetical protein